MSAPPDQEQIRGEALALVTSKRAQMVLEVASLHVLPAALSWEGSHGEMQGHRVVLGLDGASLGELDEDPASVDALEEALARAIARTPGHSLASLEIRWELEPIQRTQTYRSPEHYQVSYPNPEALRWALVGYLEHRQQPAAAQWVREAMPFLPQKAPLEVRGVIQNAVVRLQRARAEP